MIVRYDLLDERYSRHVTVYVKANIISCITLHESKYKKQSK